MRYFEVLMRLTHGAAEYGHQKCTVDALKMFVSDL
jgi:hypothetical protein